MFNPGERVLYRFNQHITKKRKDGNVHRKDERVVEVEFVKMRTVNSAVLRFRTPLGLEDRAVPLKQVFKIGSVPLEDCKPMKEGESA